MGGLAPFRRRAGGGDPGGILPRSRLLDEEAWPAAGLIEGAPEILPQHAHHEHLDATENEHDHDQRGPAGDRLADDRISALATT